MHNFNALNGFQFFPHVLTRRTSGPFIQGMKILQVPLNQGQRFCSGENKWISNHEINVVNSFFTPACSSGSVNLSKSGQNGFSLNNTFKCRFAPCSERPELLKEHGQIIFSPGLW